jgi:hypothetical protein
MECVSGLLRCFRHLRPPTTPRPPRPWTRCAHAEVAGLAYFSGGCQGASASTNVQFLRDCTPQYKQLQLAHYLLECLTVRRCCRDEERVFAFVLIINPLSPTIVLSIFRLSLPVFHQYTAYAKAESYFPSVSRYEKQPPRKRGKFNANEGTKFLNLRNSGQRRHHIVCG